MSLDKNRKIHIVDTTLRDGSHAVSHSYTVEQVTAIASGLDKVGVDIIELSHGDGLAGSSINYGFSATPEMELIRAASQVVRHARLGVLLLPGVGTIEDLKEARANGAQVVRVATHVTEADIAIQHLKAARELGMMPIGFLMMAHMAPPEKILEQAQIFVDAGAEYVNIADSAGYMTPDDVRARISLLVEKLPIPVGFHAHNNLGLAVANALTAAECGADYIDVTCRGLGAGAGNAQAEVVAGVFQRLGYSTGLDFYSYMDLAENVVEPIMQRPQIIKSAPLMLGYAGVYSSFLLHTYAPEPSALQVLERLRPLLRARGVETALEVGPGWGSYTMTLAELCREVACVDLSRDVLDFVLRAGAERGRDNITAFHAKWEAFTPERRYDLVFGYNCFYRQADLADCFRRMDRAADKLCVAGMNTGLAPAWLHELDAAGGRVSWEWKDYMYFVGVLYQMGIDANVMVLPFEKELSYPDTGALVRGECARCAPGAVDGETARAILCRHFTQRPDGSWCANVKYRSGVVWWTPVHRG